tara:strand:- start:9832 stop:10980 length:1149 start_codon:yes stop_codon:yes gene_type:complete
MLSRTTNNRCDKLDALPELTVNLAAVVDNWLHLKNQARGTVLCGAVLKADAYGLGAVPIAKVLFDAGCRNFFVAYPEEALELADQDFPETQIFILMGPDGRYLQKIREKGLIPVLSTIEHVELWAKANASSSLTRACALQVETGMHRLGLSVQSWEQILNDHVLWSHLNPAVVLSHLASADDANSPQNRRQKKVFIGIVRKAQALKKNLMFSLANSAGVFLGDSFHFDLLRPGIALFGVDPTQGGTHSLRQVVTLKARILQIETVQKGESIGYGASFCAREDCRIATVAIGYADGLPRSLEGSAYSIMLGRAARIVGRISMDMTTFDVSKVPARTLATMSHVEILGSINTVDKLARNSGITGYEVLTRIGQRVRRNYKRDIV